MNFSPEQLRAFSEAAQSLKLYRRAELLDESGRLLIKNLYVDPLPHDAVITAILKPNTTFLIGRKGTGKSTIFQKAQAELRDRSNVVSAYVDIKTLFEESQVDPALLSKLPTNSAVLPQQSLERLLLYRGFITSVLRGVRDELERKLRESFWAVIKESFTGTIDELFEDFDALLQEASTDKFSSVIATRAIEIQRKSSQTAKDNSQVSFGANSDGPSVKMDFSSANSSSQEGQQHFSDILLRTFKLKELLLALRDLLAKASIRHLYVFVDDFSELPQEAMQVTVDTLLAPLNNWSEEFIKFKIAAYPSRVYYGQIDKTKIDEFHLDIFQLYGASDINTMEAKASEFVRRLISSRIKHFCETGADAFFDSTEDDVWRTLFFASMGNPRTLGYLLFYLYESSLIYGKKIGLRAIQDAAQRYYEEKIGTYFKMSKFLHESFSERSSIFSLKELLENIVDRARNLRQHRDSVVMREIDGRPPTSHFHVIQQYEPIFSTLELNFFVSKYFEMTDRDGRKVIIYSLNYGLCHKYAIEFGRPTGKREFRTYFIERIFDFSSIVKGHIEANQEILCEQCSASFSVDQMEHLKFFGMLCPKCRKGTCRITNLSRKYEEMLRSVQGELLLPPTELGILKTLHSEKKPLFAADIAGELDCSFQLVGKRGKYLAERGLVRRDKNAEHRREFSLTEQAKESYFNSCPGDNLDISETAPPTQ